MRIVCAMARQQGAERLTDISRGHMDGTILAHPANLIFAERMAELGAGPPHDREAEPHALRAALADGALELVEDARAVGFGDAHAAVAHLEPDPPGAPPDGDGGQRRRQTGRSPSGRPGSSSAA